MTNGAPAHPSERLVTIVLPARNEERGISSTLDALPLATLSAMGLDAEVVVLDGRSTDRTPSIAREWGARVIPDRQAGKGNALREARPHFRGRHVVMLDADGSYPPDAIPQVLVPLLSGKADVVMGHRRPLPGSMKGVHRVGNRLLSTMATGLYGRGCPDLCTGLWAFRAEALAALPLRSRGFGLEAELFSLSVRLRLRVARVPTDYLAREGSPKLQWGPDGLRIVRRLVATRFVALNGARERAEALRSGSEGSWGEVGA